MNYVGPRLAALSSVMHSLVFIWHEAIADIPALFHLCDGSTVNGIVLEDLRDKFLVCADADSGGTYDVDDAGLVGKAAENTLAYTTKVFIQYVGP